MKLLTDGNAWTAIPPLGRLEETTLNLAGSEPSPPDMESSMTFRPAGSDENFSVHNLDTENGDGWKMSYHFADALCIGQDEQRRDVMELN